MDTSLQLRSSARLRKTGASWRTVTDLLAVGQTNGELALEVSKVMTGSSDTLRICSPMPIRLLPILASSQFWSFSASQRSTLSKARSIVNFRKTPKSRSWTSSTKSPEKCAYVEITTLTSLLTGVATIATYRHYRCMRYHGFKRKRVVGSGADVFSSDRIKLLDTCPRIVAEGDFVFAAVS